jgi:[acyl-carrier-protein] S-malonyltransferase
MGGSLATTSPVAADLFTRAERVLGYDLLAVIRDGPEETLRETQYAQPAIYVVNYALAAALGSALEPVVSAGHSFAELCSLTLAGALAFEDALALVNERAAAMQAASELAPGAMSAVLGLDPDALREAVATARSAGRVTLANFNAPGQIVISGDRDAVALAGELALAAGAKRVVALNVSGAWHSELMQPARERFAPFVAQAPIALPHFPVVSNVDAIPYADVAHVRENLERSVTDEVLWHATAQRLLRYELDLVVEFGGSAVLAPMFRRLEGAPKSMHVGDEKGVEKLLVALAQPAAV